MSGNIPLVFRLARVQAYYKAQYPCRLSNHFRRTHFEAMIFYMPGIEDNITWVFEQDA
jgi:hypothetical protein